MIHKIRKIREWSKRYIPSEIIGTLAALLVAYIATTFTSNLAIIAFAGTWGENIGYYGTISTRDIVESKRHHKEKNRKYGLISFGKNIRNLIIEFGFSEALDSFFVRPFFMYIFPLITGNLLLGIFLGKITADVTFYIPTIIAYETKRKHFND